MSRGFRAELKAPPPAIVAVSQAFDLPTMWYCVDRWNARWFDHHVVLCWQVECTMIWPPCGTVLTGGMHDDLTTMWYCIDRWNARWFDHHVVLCWQVECTMIWPPSGTVLTGGMHDDLTTMWYCVDRWNARWPDLFPARKWKKFAWFNCSRHLSPSLNVYQNLLESFVRNSPVFRSFAVL